MKTRAKSGFSRNRKVSYCTCQWCGVKYWSQRSNSKYCCDSHKTLANNQRQQERKANEQKLELARRARIAATRTVQPIARSPQPKVLNAPDSLISESALKELDHYIKQTFGEIQVARRAQENRTAFERISRAFVSIGTKLGIIATRGYLLSAEISVIEHRIHEVLSDPATRSFGAFSNHIYICNTEIALFLKEIARNLRISNQRRLFVTLPEQIKKGIEYLQMPPSYIAEGN